MNNEPPLSLPEIPWHPKREAAYNNGLDDGAKGERTLIVTWLRAHQDDPLMAVIANAIEDGAHRD